MVPIQGTSVQDRVLAADLEPGSDRRYMALRHALAHGEPVWVDRPRGSRCVALTRTGDGQHEVYTTGLCTPAIAGWLARLAGPVCLAAPASWRTALEEHGVGLEASALQVLRGAAESPARTTPGKAGPVRPDVRMLDAADPRDVEAFRSLVPGWAYRSWGCPRICVSAGLVAGVPYQGGLAAAAWLLETDGLSDALGVFTAAPYRRLGLARMAAAALIAARRRALYWFVDPANAPSLALARSLGLGAARDEVLLRYHRPGPD